MKIKTLIVGDFQVNCYIISEKGKCIVVDPGYWWEDIKAYIDEKDLTMEAVLITHAHFDHIGGLVNNEDLNDIPIYAHEVESSIMGDPKLNLSAQFGSKISVKATHFIEDDEEIKIGPFKIKGIVVPGHSEKSVCYYFLTDQIVITGDTLFQRGIGRTDLYSKSPTDLIRNIKAKLFILPGETVVYPGHGPCTTIDYEKEYNPYI